MTTLNFAEEFSRYPYGRNGDDGRFNAEAFRELLADRFAQAQARQQALEIVLDNVSGMSGSFIRAAFGKFAEEKQGEGITLGEDNLRFNMDSPLHDYYIDQIWGCIKQHSSSANYSNY